MSRMKQIPQPFGPPKWVPDDTPPIPMTTMVAVAGKNDDRIKEILGPEGMLCRGEGMAYRPAQHQLAQFAFRALDQRKHLLAEAGTGTGKSFGLLVPLIEYAMRNGVKAVISTAQNVLLDQYKNKDLPRLQQELKEYLVAKYGRNFTWATLKGRSNYYCPMSRHNEVPDDCAAQVDQVWEWLEVTKTGDLAELPFDVNRYLPLKQSLVSESDECPGASKCEAGESCWYYGAKATAAEADILIVNHALLACDLVSGGQLLPNWDVFAIDEAHQWGKYVQSALEAVIKPRRWHRMARKLRQHEQAEGSLIESMPLKHGSAKLLEDKVAIWQTCLEKIAEKCNPGDKLDLRGQVVPQEFWDANASIVELLHRFAVELEQVDITSALPLARACNELRLSLQGLDFGDPKSASWVELDRLSKAELHVVPIDISSFLAEHLWKYKPGILASATLATSCEVGREFEFCKTELGTPGHPYELVLPSPFDWNKQALYLYPSRGFLSDRDFKPKFNESYRACVYRWVNKAWPMVRRAIERTKGRAFVLCTSRMACEAFAECHVATKLKFPFRSQGDGSKQALIDWFKATDNPVLYATSSFWEGVDIPGDQLQLVVIDKIPFPNTLDPLEKARCDRLGREAFDLYQIPLAITHLKQGVGRLIRTETDKGILLLLDPRFLEKGYGKKIASALPGDALEAMRRPFTNIAAFLAGYPVDSIDSQAAMVVSPSGRKPAQIVSLLHSITGVLDYQERGHSREHFLADVEKNHTPLFEYVQQYLSCGGLTMSQWQRVEQICEGGIEEPCPF